MARRPNYGFQKQQKDMKKQKKREEKEEKKRLRSEAAKGGAPLETDTAEDESDVSARPGEIEDGADAPQLRRG